MGERVDGLPEMGAGVAKVVVVGAPGCGKTTFIRSFYDRHHPGGMYSHHNAWLYACRLEEFNQERRAVIFDVSGDPSCFLKDKILFSMSADIFVIMYAIDDPESLQAVHTDWIPYLLSLFGQESLPVVFVGNKRDLRENQQVMERLANEDLCPVTTEQGLELSDRVPGLSSSKECSSSDPVEVDLVFQTIFDLVRLNEE